MTALARLRRSASLASAGLSIAGDGGARRERLTSRLGALHGLPEKLSQLLALGQLANAEARYDAFTSGSPALSQKKARALLESCFGPLERTFSSVNFEGHSASLGQVHRATLHDGREVALKLQYPGMADALRVDLGALSLAGKGAKRGYDLATYRRTLGEMIERELDYRLEAELLARFGALTEGDDELVVPRVVPELCRFDRQPPVLAMTWLEGLTLQQARSLPLAARAEASRALVRWFLRSTLEWGLVHGDLHPGNLRFVTSGNRVALGVLDFGCAHALDAGVAGGLRLLLEAAACDDDGAPERWLARYQAIGFSTQLLEPIRDRLRALTRVLLAPLLTRGAFDPATWDLSARMEGLLGEHRMVFRVAAPSSFAFVTRAFVGLVQVLRALEAPIAWKPLFDEISTRSTVSQPGVLALAKVADAAPPREAKSRSLRICVTRDGQRVVETAFPASAAERLGGLIPPDVVPRLAPRGIDVTALETRAVESAFAPGELFSLSEPDRTVRVWLE